MPYDSPRPASTTTGHTMAIDSLTHLCDETLMVLIMRREDAALGVLYDRYGGFVFTIALRMTGDYAVAEEVTQDVFHHVWKSAGGFRVARGTCSSWIIGITRHRAIDATRSSLFRAHACERQLQSDLPDDPTHEPGYVTDRHLTSETVRHLLADLPPLQRHVLELAYYDEMTQGEIANHLQEPVGTIKTRMRLGMRKLRMLWLMDAQREESVRCNEEADTAQPFVA